MLLPETARKLGLQGTLEDLGLRTIRQDIQILRGAAVTFRISPVSQPKTSFLIKDAFTATLLGLAEHSYPVTSLQKKYKHRDALPLQSFENAQPLILIGANNPHLITPIEPLRFGPPGGPAAILTRLGWTLQGPARLVEQHLRPQQCLLTSITPPESELF